MDPNIRALLLNKFIQLMGQEITEFKKTFSKIEFAEYPGQTFHMISAGGRGIYKPKDSPHALSIRCDKNDNPYDDKIYFDKNNNFEKLIYHGPISNKYPNRANNDIDSLIACYEDKIPFGIIYVLDKKKSYISLGLGIIKSHNNNEFEIIPYDLINDNQMINNEIENQNELQRDKDLISDKITEKRYSLKVRTAQSEFRNNLINSEKKCLLCEIDFKPLLIASHIKPWAKCTNTERMDINNGLLLCPLHDKLFDKGYLSFDDNMLIISKSINNDIQNTILFNKFVFNDQKKNYLNYHKNNIFKND